MIPLVQVAVPRQRLGQRNGNYKKWNYVHTFHYLNRFGRVFDPCFQPCTTFNVCPGLSKAAICRLLSLIICPYSSTSSVGRRKTARNTTHVVIYILSSFFSATFPTLQLKGSRRFLLPSGTSVCVSTISGTICWGGWFSRQLMRTCNIYTQGWDTSGWWFAHFALFAFMC